MGFEPIAPPQKSRLWKSDDVDAAQAVLAEHGQVGWADAYDSEGKARGAGSALARLLNERTKDAYRVRVFEKAEGDFYFSLKVKTKADTGTDGTGGTDSPAETPAETPAPAAKKSSGRKAK